MPKPNSKYVSPKHVFDAEISKLPGSRKSLQRKELARQLKYPVDFADEEFEQELEMKDVDDFMKDEGDR